MWMDGQQVDLVTLATARRAVEEARGAPQAEPVNAELLRCAKDLDEAYCRAGPGLTREERAIDRKRLIAARAAIARAEAQKPQRLTDAEIDAAWDDWFSKLGFQHPAGASARRGFARAIERRILGDAT